jgi:hypothetical protein
MSFLPQADREWLESSGYAYREVVEGNKHGVILELPLPPGKFQVGRAEILIQILPGYPDTPLDMFWADPALFLVSSGRQPACTIAEGHFGRSWQRWSRHYKQGKWRPGIDDLSSHVTVVLDALRRAA